MSQLNNKITESHLKRKAIIYLRQSSDKQVQNNKESPKASICSKGSSNKMGMGQR